ncbi:ankyrin [Rhodofomes roseus]|uniref:Ankyrin n=1 Tax=Rhodofomes roseus TaxID=34475 RepID=A0ABQ8K0R9_9APHY|nr:ankyrin [Rhodofomes roseus]KAH9830020.1 ankyrin [Rhodofomes roseus]
MVMLSFDASDNERGADGNGGYDVHPEMMAILNRTTGFIKDDDVGKRFRHLYRGGTLKQDPSKLKQFAFDCFFGQIAKVKRAVESGQAPDLTGTETPYKFGYCTLVIAGGQRGAAAFPGADHAATLKFLISSGVPMDSCDIAGLTALHHATQSTDGPTLALVRILLESGANVNLQNRYGEIPLLCSFHMADVRLVELFMEFGADLDIPSADGTTGRMIFVNIGPAVTAAITKWIRKRSGERKPLDGKSCAKCGEADVALKICKKCHAAKYCSPECQREDWPTHKQTCTPFDGVTSVTVRPTYRDIGTLMSPLELTRQAMNLPAIPRPRAHYRSVHTPHVEPDQPKAMVVKVQVPYLGGPVKQGGPLLMYNKKRSLVCTLEVAGNETAYARIAETVWTKGVNGAKAYFPAELNSQDELVIKVGEVLAEQSF